MKETLFSNLRYFAPTMSILSSSISYSLVVISSKTCSGDAIFSRSCSVAVRFTSLSPSSNITWSSVSYFLSGLRFSTSRSLYRFTLQAATFLMSPWLCSHMLCPFWQSTSAGPNNVLPSLDWNQTLSPSLKSPSRWYHILWVSSSYQPHRILW